MGNLITLKKLLENLKSQSEEAQIEACLQEILEYILLQTSLRIGENIIRPLEIEAYYKTTKYPDDTVHGHSRQKTFNKLYVHRYKNSEKPKLPHRMGLDICLSDGDCYFGILLRSIETQLGKKIFGPSLTAEFITQLFHCQEKVLELEKLENVLFEESSRKDCKTYISKRVGLGNKEFKDRPLRRMVEIDGHCCKYGDTGSVLDYYLHKYNVSTHSEALKLSLDILNFKNNIVINDYLEKQ